MVMCEGLREALAQLDGDKKIWLRQHDMAGDPKLKELNKKLIAGVKRNLGTLDDVLALFPKDIRSMQSPGSTTTAASSKRILFLTRHAAESFTAPRPSRTK